MRGGPRADDIAIRVAQCLERMRRDIQAKSLELFGEVAFSPPECGWRGNWMAFSDQRTEMRVIHGAAPKDLPPASALSQRALAPGRSCAREVAADAAGNAVED